MVSAPALPLSSLLSQTLVAFIIEFDNEFEHLVPHRTTNHGSTSDRPAPWLVSMVMWLKFMRFVPDDGTSVSELQRSSGMTNKELRLWLTRMSKWWGYVVVDKQEAKPSNSRVRPTSGGQKALNAWRPLTGTIEQRWQERFGKDVINRLHESLQALLQKLDGDLPDYLPILGFELLSKSPTPDHAHTTPVRELTLPILLSKALLAFAIEFERDSVLPLTICANVLRVTADEGVRVRDLPRLSGVSKEAIAMCVGRLEERGFAVVQPESTSSRTKVLVLTPNGRHARDNYTRIVRDIEEHWKARVGEPAVTALRQSLETLVVAPAGQPSPLFAALQPYPEGWRASIPNRETLPHYPMVLHRGGFPDGS